MVVGGSNSRIVVETDEQGATRGAVATRHGAATSLEAAICVHA
jgi:hypothetical protein